MMNELDVKKEEKKDLTFRQGVIDGITFYLPLYGFFVKVLACIVLSSLMFKILGI